MNKAAQHLSQVAGCTVELTVRGPRSFTFSTEQVNTDAAQKIMEFLGDTMICTVEHDEELGTFIYADLPN